MIGKKKKKKKKQPGKATGTQAGIYPYQPPRTRREPKNAMLEERYPKTRERPGPPHKKARRGILEKRTYNLKTRTTCGQATQSANDEKQSPSSTTSSSSSRPEYIER